MTDCPAPCGFCDDCRIAANAAGYRFGTYFDEGTELYNCRLQPHADARGSVAIVGQSKNGTRLAVESAMRQLSDRKRPPAPAGLGQ